ncbi:MAG: peptidase M75 [Pleurocapsa minor HA4230-MV1]|nr:peptidase M75 [Pleurocapsa minor HA4230-MV1]
MTIGTGCSNNVASLQTSSANETSTSANETVVLTDFVDRLVIPTYQELIAKSTQLEQAVATFVKTPNEQNLKAAQSAWQATRTPWEQSEAFAFGPAESLGYDANLDDWPVNQTDVTGLIKSQEKLDQNYVETKLQSTQKGFHTIEYFLFGENNNRQANELSKRELELLQLLTTDFHKTAEALKESWVAGVDGQPAFREVFTTAGDSSNTTYPTVEAALTEIVSGIVGCVEEVGEVKIGKPIETKQDLDFESRFSHNSLTDFKNNLISARNAYMGEAKDTEGQGVSDLVAKKDPALDREIRTQLDTALKALETVPAPIETKFSDAATLEKLKTAQSEILTTYQTIQEKVVPLFAESTES